MKQVRDINLEFYQTLNGCTYNKSEINNLVGVTLPSRRKDGSPKKQFRISCIRDRQGTMLEETLCRFQPTETLWNQIPSTKAVDIPRGGNFADEEKSAPGARCGDCDKETIQGTLLSFLES